MPNTYGVAEERWPVERTWKVRTGRNSREKVSSNELNDYRACGLLGAAGLGKSYELQWLASVDRRDGLDVRFERLAVLGQTPDGLASQLHALIAGAHETTTIYLDALDEVMVPVKVAALVLERWIRDQLAVKRPIIRISCRSAVWPQSVLIALQDVYGEDACAIALLQPISTDDINSVATKYGVDADQFDASLLAAGAQVLAQQPLTLKMLLRLYQQGGALPKNRGELFARGVEELAVERVERRESGTAVDFTLDEVLEAAERLACLVLLCGRDSIDLSDSTFPSSLGVIELSGLPSGGRKLDDELVRAVGRTGLCDSDGPRRFRFAHRQLAEYLAGRRLARLLFHQSRALLSSSLGWQSGVAGPLRETAAFAAMHSDDIATWVSDHDPEVIGISDVADDNLRRRATLNLLEKFRRHELTDAQLVRSDSIELAGYRYDKAEQDLRPVLIERQEGCDDVLECAVKMIVQWELVSMSDDLVDLALDGTAPLEARRSGGYALMQMGTKAARSRLRPLISDDRDDPDLDLKGLALKCNWPDQLTVPELLSAIAARGRESYGGAYRSFLSELERSGFNAAGHRLEGLAWASKFLDRDSDFDPHGRIARRIAIAAVDELEEPGIAEALADVLSSAAQTHAHSPLALPQWTGTVNPPDEPPLHNHHLGRRRLIDALAARADDDSAIWWAAHETPNLVLPDDFLWLLARATTDTFPMWQRERYAQLAGTVSWQDNVENVEGWLAVRTIEPITSYFPSATYIDLDSKEAVAARKAYAQVNRRQPLVQRKTLQPAPSERVDQVLSLSETKDATFFLNLANELTLEEYSTHYGFARFLSKTPGWTAASETTRERITSAAKRLLAAESDEPERCRTRPFNSILPGYMAAIWLLSECDPSWLEALPAEWWEKWCWYILRELRPGFYEEPDEPKLALVQLLHDRAAASMRATLQEMVALPVQDSISVLPSLLNLIVPLDDTDIDALLCQLLTSGEIPGELAGNVARFVLLRSGKGSMSACLSCLEPDAVLKTEDVAVSAAVALLQTQPAPSWPVIHEFLERRPDLAPRVLGNYAHRPNLNSDEDTSGLAKMDCEQIGQLVAFLLTAFPPENDPRHEGAHWISQDDDARELRGQLISYLGDQSDVRAVEALRSLEQRFAKTCPWLRRPRARAEQAYRRSRSVPVAPLSVAEVLASQSKRLIRSEQDAIDGVAAAVVQYSQRLHHEGANDIEDLWNLPKGRPRTPREEERVSVKVCAAIREYFREYALTADREVQIFRRKLPSESGGAPGSEVDVLCTVPAVGAKDAMDRIIVPVEVKLSHNNEAQTGLKNQLVDRYMAELGTTCGVYVVAWMGKVKGSTHRPVWKSIQDAQEDLVKQASELSTSMNGLRLEALVIDASLPAAKQSKSNPKKRPEGGKKRTPLARPRTGPKPKKTNRTGKKRLKKKSKPSNRRPGSA